MTTILALVLEARGFHVLVFESRGAAVSLIGGTLGGAARLMFIAAREDANAAGLRLPGIRENYARARAPKEFKLLEGSAHGQNILSTPDGAAVMRDIIRFLENRRP
jgi:hypothetical protein